MNTYTQPLSRSDRTTQPCEFGFWHYWWNEVPLKISVYGRGSLLIKCDHRVFSNWTFVKKKKNNNYSDKLLFTARKKRIGPPDVKTCPSTAALIWFYLLKTFCLGGLFPKQWCQVNPPKQSSLNQSANGRMGLCGVSGAPLKWLNFAKGKELRWPSPPIAKTVLGLLKGPDFTVCAKSCPLPLSYHCTQRKELTLYLRHIYCQNIAFNCCPGFPAAVEDESETITQSNGA